MPLLDNIRPEPNPLLTVERVELARAMYVEGFTVSRICPQCLISLGTLYTCLDGTPFGADGLRFPPIPRRRNILGKRTRALRADPASLRNRLMRTAEGQVREIELRLSLPGRSGPERERDIRMLGMTVKSLRDLKSLHLEDDVEAPPGTETRPCATCPHADDMPEDIDEFRYALARRIEAFVKSRTAQKKDEQGGEGG
jgi:hypothetical protein